MDKINLTKKIFFYIILFDYYSIYRGLTSIKYERAIFRGVTVSFKSIRCSISEI